MGAGTKAVGINPRPVQVMNEIGINLEGQSLKSVEHGFHRYRFTLCGDAAENCPTFPVLSKKPTGRSMIARRQPVLRKSLKKFRETRAKIEKHLR